MMRKEGLLKYTVFLLVCFFSLIITSKAAEDGTVTTNVTLPYGSTYTISNVGYTGFTCDTSGLSALSATSNSTGYSIKLKEVTKNDGTETVTCTYEKKTAVNNAGADTNGKRIYKITYTAGVEETFEYYLGFGIEYIDVAAQLGATKIIDYSVQTKGSEYISMSQCPKGSANCKVYMSEMAEDLDSLENYIAIVTFKYNVSGSTATYTANVHFNINAFQGAFIWDNWTDSNPLGYCEYGSEWEQATTDARSNGQKFYYYRSSSTNATLPNCTPNPSSVIPVKFKGWIAGVEGTTAVSFGNGNNSYLYATGKCPTTISSGTKVTADTNYAPCYEMDSNYVRLSLSTGKVTASGWTVSTSSNYEYYHTAASADETIALPDVVYTGFNETKSLQCWKNNTTGECVAAGTVVKTDGTVYIAVTDVEHKDYSYYKSVKVNNAVVFAVEGMKSCSLADGQPSGYLSVADINGDCLVTGLKVTDANQYIQVDAVLESGGKKIYNFSVESDVGLSAGGNGTFYVDPLVNSGEENAYTDSSGFNTSACSNFVLTPGERVEIGGGLFSNTYSVSVSSECSNDNGKYIAFCLDPGRQGPDYGNPIKYEKVDDINTNTEMGKFIAYLAEHVGIENFVKVGDKERIAAHVAIRIVALKSGFGSTSSIAYWHLHAPYQNTVSAINEKNPTTAEEYKNIIIENMGINEEYAALAGKYLAEYSANYNDDDALGFERTIDYSASEAYGNGYIITYKGTITAPANASNVNMVAPGPNNGVSFKVVSWSEASTTETGRTVYNYEVQITANNTMAVIPPTNDEDKMQLSFKITFDGGQSVSNIFIAQPIDEAGELQRMIIFNTDATDLYIYFNIAPNNCDLPGLDYTVCKGEDNCPSDQFNKALFKASGCCRYVTDEDQYEYVVNNVCAALCTTSTMANVCDYSSTNKLAELYKIKEGSKYSSTDKKYVNAVGSCIADVDKPFVNSYNNYVDYDDNASNNTNSTTYTAHEFENFDDNGNSLMVDYYERDDNQYCRINCREEWQISMDGFGNYVGEKAVAAGSYFQIENDIFIGGKRTCYTNYIDYHKYMNELAHLSAVIISAYNEYSKESHSYSDILDMQDIGDNTITSDGKVSWYYRERWCSRSCWMEDDKVGSGQHKVCGDVSCSDKDVTELGQFYQFTYSDVQNEFSGGDAGTGSYQTYSSELYDGQDGYDSTQHKTDKSGQPSYSTDHSRSITCSRTTCNLSGECDPGDEKIGTNTCKIDDCTETEANVTCTDNQYIREDNPDLAFPYLEEKLLDDIEAELNGLRGTIGSAAASIRKKIDDMYDCQHFQLVNTTDENSDYADTDKLSGTYHSDGTKDYIQISTAFDPEVSYEYAEDAFMSILLRNKENYLVKYDKKNDAYYGGTEGAYKNATNETKDAKVKLTTTEEITVQLARNKLQFTYYDIGTRSGMWQAETDEWRNYGCDPDDASCSVSHDTIDSAVYKDTSITNGKYTLKQISLCGITGDNSGSSYVTTTNFKGVSSTVLVGGSSTPEWKGGSCFNITVPYLSANYISASIENSSFYRNQGSWYANIQDVKAHGDGLEAALNNENANNKSGYKVSDELSSGRWTPIGIMNVFPISLTTPRNLYTYTYTFKDIGSHSGGDLGRIMGDDTAIIANNNRTCFYEVFEELCLCCGDKINTYVYNDPDENDLIKQVMAASGYGESNTDKIEENEGGTLAFATTTVNLSDVDVDESARPVATNWSNSSPFTYGGEYNLTTSKGDQLKNAIESQGETIYSSSSAAGGAEYAYYLTPTTLTKIREYNDEHGYELNYNNLKVYGRYSIALLSSSCSNLTDNNCWKTDVSKMNDEVINFQHYGSVFLEDLAKDSNIVKSNTLAKEGNDKVCVVVDGQFDASTINSLVKSGCRWIDYVENLGDNSGKGETSYVYPYTESTSSQQTVTYFRLAFK